MLAFPCPPPLTQQVFATFCGLGIHSVMNYETILKANAKQSVALEVRRRLYDKRFYPLNEICASCFIIMVKLPLLVK